MICCSPLHPLDNTACQQQSQGKERDFGLRQELEACPLPKQRQQDPAGAVSLPLLQGCQGIIPSGRLALPRGRILARVMCLSRRAGECVSYPFCISRGREPGAGSRGEAAIWARLCVHTAGKEQRRRGSSSADVWAGSLSLPSISVVPPRSSGSGGVWLQTCRVYVFVRSTCWEKNEYDTPACFP